MFVQVISGSAKKMKLKVPQKGTRPLSNRAKNALFSILDTRIKNSDVADLYAGSGALGIESLSRGAKSAVFVDISKESKNIIEENLERTGFSALGQAFQMFTKRFISYAFQNNYKFDLIFISPPYKNVDFRIVEKAAVLLKKEGIIIAEHPSNVKFAENTEQLEKVDERKYGRVGLSFYKIRVQA